jgi:hypothetical protein
MTLRAAGLEVIEFPLSATGLADDVAGVHGIPRNPIPAPRTDAQFAVPARSLEELQSDLSDMLPLGSGFAVMPNRLRGKEKV